MPRVVRQKDVVLLLPPPSTSLPKNGESSKMALQHQPPSLDVLLMAHQEARERGEQMDIEAYMTDEMRREWFSRSRPFLATEERRYSQDGESEGSGTPARKKRRGMSMPDENAEPSSTASSPHHADLANPAYTPLFTKRSRTSTAEKYWHQRRRSYLPDEPETKPSPAQLGDTAVPDGLAGASQDGKDGAEVNGESNPADGMIIHPPAPPPHSGIGSGTGHWRKKPEAEVDRDEIQASASYWNTLLIRARKDRGPQWDYSTQSHQVDRHSRAYYTHMDKPPPEAPDAVQGKGTGPSTAAEAASIVLGQTGVGAGTGGDVPSFKALTRTGSISEDNQRVSGGMAIPSLPFPPPGAPPAEGQGGIGMKISRSQSHSSSTGVPPSIGATLLPEQLPPRSDSLFTSQQPGPALTPSAPGAAQLQALHQQQQQLLLQHQQQQAHLQQSQQSSAQQQQQQQFAQQLGMQRFPPHLQHLAQQHLHPQYASPTSSNNGHLPPTLTPSPVNGLSQGQGQEMQTMSPAAMYTGQAQGQGQGQNGGPQRNPSFSSNPSHSPNPNPMAQSQAVGVNGNISQSPLNGSTTGFSYPNPQSYPSSNNIPQSTSSPFPPSSQIQAQAQSMLKMQPAQRLRNSISDSPSPAGQKGQMQAPSQGQGPGQVQGQGQNQEQGQGQQQHPWVAQAQSMGLSLQQFQALVAQHQAQQAQGQHPGQGQNGGMGMNGMMGRPGTVSLAQLTAGPGANGMNGMGMGMGMWMRGGAGQGGPMLGGGGGG